MFAYWSLSKPEKKKTVVFSILNSASSEWTALVILLPAVTIGFNCFCVLGMCNYVFCVFLTSLVI